MKQRLKYGVAVVLLMCCVTTAVLPGNGGMAVVNAEEDGTALSYTPSAETTLYEEAKMAYAASWRSWKQGESAYSAMRSSGCRMVSYAKLLMATGVETSGSFTPDVFYEWCRDNGYIANVIDEKGSAGDCAVAYAKDKGSVLKRIGTEHKFRSDAPEERKQEIISLVSEGYYVILCSRNHFCYVDEEKTKETGELWVDDSNNGSNVYRVDRVVNRQSLADGENDSPGKNWTYRYFRTEGTAASSAEAEPSGALASPAPETAVSAEKAVTPVAEQPAPAAGTVREPHLCWKTGADGKSYWYENGVVQGTHSDPQGVRGHGSVRGREICDPESNAWYWLDSAFGGAKALGKEVWIPYVYQNESTFDEDTLSALAERSSAGDAEMGGQVKAAVKNRTGKWVRYDRDGKMIKGWYTVGYDNNDDEIYPDQAGNTYFYDPVTGLMAKGRTVIAGVTFPFDEKTGVLQWQGRAP